MNEAKGYTMRTVTQWLDEYGESHRNPVNKRLHSACVPAIVIAVIGLFWSLPVPASFAKLSPWLNWATIAAILSLAYYFALSPPLSVGSALVFAVMFGIVLALEQLAWPLWQTCTAIFIVAWVGQFIGHAFEGKRPSFFKDLQFLLIGPLWLLAFVYLRLGLPLARSRDARPGT
ncbi:MAG: Mpo1-like protein [Steroidobacteraceae bacterium]